MSTQQTIVWFEPVELIAFRDCWRMYDEHFDEIVSSLSPPALGIMPSTFSGASQEAQRLREDSRTIVPLVWAAVESGDWGDIEARFEARGQLFATYGVNIDTWADLVMRGLEVMTPIIVLAHAQDPPHLGRVLAAMQSFWRRAVGVARRRYLATSAELVLEQRLALRRSEARYRVLAESGIVGTMIADSSGLVLEANDAFLRMLGHTQDDVALGRLHSGDLTPPEWAPLSQRALVELSENGVSRPRERRYRRSDGSLVPVLVGVAALETSQTITFALDLSERQRLEEQLRQSQKLEAIGSLAGGVAHDFNNLLSVILSNCDFALEDLESDSSSLREEVEEIRRAGERAAALTGQLLAFSRKQILRPRVIELGDVVRGMEPLIRRLVGSPIRPVVVLRPESAPIFADAHQIEQVLMNLIVNARDAMPDGGEVTIELDQREIGPDEAEFLSLHPQTYVVLCVSDTGAGMDAETRSHIFEPFFSTKGEKGTGLGLSTAFGIVRQHEGAITVQSEPGHGTTFAVLLPRTERDPETQPVAPRRVTLGGHETILLVEDEDDVRRVMVEVLERSGYRVLSAGHGEEALSLAARHAGEIELVVTDLVMPHANGREVAARIRASRPAVRVLYVSGYAADSHFNQAPLASDAHFLAKPITPQSLLDSVRRTLDSPRQD